MTPRAIYWDMDGTLLDSEPLHEQALVAALRSAGIEPPPDLHERVIGRAAYPVYEMLRDEFGLSLPFDEWIVRKYEHYLPNVDGIRPRPGAVEIFGEANERGLAQAVVSNSDRLIVEANLRAAGLQYPGMKTVSRNDVRVGKPDAEPYLRAAYLTGVDPADTAVVEDSVLGAMAGVAAGMKTLFWPEKPMAPPPGAVLVLDADELRSHLLGG